MGEGAQPDEASPHIESALAFAAGALVLVASLANLLLFNRYPLATIEVGLLVAVAFAIAAIMVPIYGGQRRWGKAFLAGLLVFLAVDLNSDSSWAAAALGLAAAVASWKMGSGLLRFLALLAAVALAVSLLGLAERRAAVSVNEPDVKVPRASVSPSASEPAPPLIVHLILDEMGGLPALRAMDPDGPRFADDVRAALVNSGFTIDSLAYTPSSSTIQSVPAALNFGRKMEVEGTVEGGGSMGEAEMFRTLRYRGYKLRLWQTSYLDFCDGNPFDECVTVDVNHLRILRETDLPATDRAVLIGANLLAKSLITSKLSDVVDASILFTGATGSERGLPPMLMQRRYVSTLHADETLRELTEQLRHARPGEAYVAHILLPHYPFSFNLDCSLRHFGRWEAPWGRRSIEERRRRYEQQYRCALRRIREIVMAVEDSAAAGNAMVIVHGDHGPRIRDPSSDEAALKRTLHSALFAVRRSEARGSVLARPCSIGDLLAATIASDSRTAECANAREGG